MPKRRHHLFKFLFDGFDNPVDLIYDSLDTLSPGKEVKVACEPDGSRYGPAIFRVHYETHSYKPHIDHVKYRENRTDYQVYRFRASVCRCAMRPKRRRTREKAHKPSYTGASGLRISSPILPKKRLTDTPLKMESKTIRSIFSKATSTFSTRAVSTKYHPFKVHAPVSSWQCLLGILLTMTKYSSGRNLFKLLNIFVHYPAQSGAVIENWQIGRLGIHPSYLLSACPSVFLPISLPLPIETGTIFAICYT